MLELDALLQTFLRDAYADLDEPGRRAFDRLLQQPDMDLYDWLTGRGAPPVDLRAVVDRLRACRVGPPRPAPGSEVTPGDAPPDEPGAVAA